MTEADVYLILTSQASHGALSKQLGVHRSAISQIRLGKTHRQMAPDVPRWSTARRCTTCMHWGGDRCGLGFPDPLEESVAFARDCAVFSDAHG